MGIGSEVYQAIKSFNSILVQLEAFAQNLRSGKHLSFNSILVQLEALFCSDLYGSLTMFQFHIGAIRSLLPPCLLFFVLRFNSILVQLEDQVAACPA